MKFLNKKIIILLNMILILFFTSCTTNKVFNPVNDNVRKVNVFSIDGKLTKSYYEKYNQKFNGWLKIVCKKISKIENTKSFENCDFTNISLAKIKNSKNKDTQVGIVKSSSENSEENSNLSSDNNDGDNSEGQNPDDFIQLQIEGCNDIC